MEDGRQDCKFPKVVPPASAACTCYKATQLSLVTLASDFLQPGAERTTLQGHPGQQVIGSRVEECRVGAKAQGQQLMKESRLNMDVNEARLKLLDGESWGDPGPRWGQAVGASEWPGYLFNTWMSCASHLPSTPLLFWCLGRPPRYPGSPDLPGTLAGKV